jgi:MYXO-CTERM domain-containing protein
MTTIHSLQVRNVAAAQTILMVAVTFVWSSVTTSYAAVVNIDINAGSTPTFSGLGAAPDAGTIWNPVNNPATGKGNSFSSGPLVTSTGGASSITFSAGVAEASTDWTTDGDLFRDGVRAFFGNSASFTISGLVASEIHNIYLYSAAGSFTGNGASFTITGYGTQIASGTTGGPAYVLDDNYVLFSGITGVTSLSGTYTNSATDHGAFNGLQIESQSQAVPEPSTYALGLLGLAGLGLLTWRSKRRRDAAGW